RAVAPRGPRSTRRCSVRLWGTMGQPRQRSCAAERVSRRGGRSGQPGRRRAPPVPVCRGDRRLSFLCSRLAEAGHPRAARGGGPLFGSPPFYALARIDEDYAIGGPNGVRGVPAERYYGKAKVMASAEVRGNVASFRTL